MVANVTVWVPGSGPGVSDTWRPFDSAVSAAAMVSEMSKVAL